MESTEDVELISQDSADNGVVLASAGEHVARKINAGKVARKPEKIKPKPLIPECEA